MPSALTPLMNTPQTAIGKGTVGEPAPAPEGKKGVQFKVALFFDGTMNNRANTTVRLKGNEQIKDGSKKDLILDNKKKNMLSSYANYYSNVSILELLNLQRDREIQEVSVYVEGIGTVNYEAGVTRKNKHGGDETNLLGMKKKIPTQDADISNDQQGGYAFGTGFTGIVDRVTQGIRNAKDAIRAAYKPDKQYIEKITIDVIGFSRGAAAARHFVSRYEGFRGIWPAQEKPPELVVNFVGLFETVSSYEEKNSLPANAVKKGLFSKNVGELQLALGGRPLRVVHLTAQDEMRHNFSLTTIDSSLRAGNGFQVSLPGVHSDVGGGYVEPDPDNPGMDPTKTYPNEPGRPAIRELNQENRRILNQAEKLQLLAEGWYTDGTNGTLNQLEPVDESLYEQHLAKEADQKEWDRQRGYPYRPAPYTGEVYGSRYLSNEYQYVSLYLMRCMAKNDFKPGKHTPMRFQELRGEDGVYEVPPDLVAIRDHFEGCIKGEAFADGKPDNELAFETDEQGQKIRNKYLHRSSRIAKDITSYDGFTTWVAYKRAAKDTRVVYSDTGDSAKGQPVAYPKLEAEEPKVPGTAATTGGPATEGVPTGSGLGERPRVGE